MGVIAESCPCSRLEQIISLAISEAFAGSDVAGLRTTATKSEDGKTWTINGTKKWISGGMHSDYFVSGPFPDAPCSALDPLSRAYRHCQFRSGRCFTADTPQTVGARTDGGLTVFLVPRGEGVETKQIKTSYSTAAGTAYITFDNVKVPAENMLGPEDGGLLVILSNFNVSASHAAGLACVQQPDLVGH